jgi:hypothetical protein
MKYGVFTFDIYQTAAPKIWLDKASLGFLFDTAQLALTDLSSLVEHNVEHASHAVSQYLSNLPISSLGISTRKLC